MGWGALWMLIPDEALPLIIAGIGVTLMLGFISGRGALMLILSLVLLPPLLAPFIEGILGELPPWMSLLILAVLGLAILRALVGILLGQRAADTMVGSLAADLVRLSVSFLLFPFRVVGWGLRMVNGNGLR
jgi:hypothetical protein